LDKEVIIKRITVGELQTNCYLLINTELKKSILIDAAAQPKVIKEAILKSRVTLEAVLITHGHADHIGALESFDVPIYIHEQDAAFLGDDEKNLSALFGFPLRIKAKKDIHIVHDNQIIDIAGMALKVLHVPGHTPGSICLFFDSALFSGDALFAGSIGRTDLPYGSTKNLIEAIKHKILPLADDIKVYPGHGESSTVGQERRSNPFLN
jgi:glyoxylase-like metal-dependent hydrolase (beta-lactamase superfamily II)